MREKMTKAFFFDTYALIEIGKNNPNYEPYKKDVRIFISMLNLMELAYFLIRENRESEIEEIFNNLSKFSRFSRYKLKVGESPPLKTTKF